MGRMPMAYLRHQSINSATRNKDGTLRKNGSMEVNINMDALVKKVHKLVQKEIEQAEYSPSASKPMNKTSTKSVSKVNDDKRKGWKISALGAVALTNSLALSSISLIEHHKSGDEASRDKKLASSVINGTILLAGTFGGPAGIATSVALSTIYGYASTYIGNSIQNKYDTERLNYRMANYDLRKNATYTYDTTSGKWTHKELNKTRAMNLSNKQST